MFITDWKEELTSILTSDILQENEEEKYITKIQSFDDYKNNIAERG